MLEILTNQEVLSFNYSDLLALIDEQQISKNELAVLEQPGLPEDKLGALDSSEIKLAVFVKELENRLDAYFTQPAPDSVDDEQNSSDEMRTFTELDELHEFVCETLQDLMKHHIDFDEVSFTHPLPTSDGHIYGCRGNCVSCFLNTFEFAEFESGHAIGEGCAH